MSLYSGTRVLVLGGIRSGKSELAEALITESATAAARVRYIATAPDDGGDTEWTARLTAHRSRRPAGWTTEEIGATPARLAELLRSAAPEDLLLVDDLGGWLNATLRAVDGWTDPTSVAGATAGLAEAVRACPAARLVLVGPEVGMAVSAATPAGRTFADANGTLNQRIAAACDAVALVVAGHPVWLRDGRPTPPTTAPQPGSPGSGSPASAEAAPTVVPTAAPTAVPTEDAVDTRPAFSVDGARADVAAPVADGEVPELSPGLDLPLPDDRAAVDAEVRLNGLDFAGSGLGVVTAVVKFAAGTQAVADPRPWRSVRTLLLLGEHEGGGAAGDLLASRRRWRSQAAAGEGALAILAARADASIRVVECPPSGAMETTDVLDETAVDAALAHGWQLAQQAADEGADLITLASLGRGSDAAAAAVVSVTTGGEPAALLARVIGPHGYVDDRAWMARCAAVRDALNRVRARPRDPRTLLSMLGGGDLAVAAGIIIGAATRRTPVMLDGPVGVAAALIARDYGAQTRHWLLLPDHGGHPTVRLAADVLGVPPVLELKLGLGEGTTTLAALPLLNAALTLAAATPPIDPTEVEPEDEGEPEDESGPANEAGPEDESGPANEAANKADEDERLRLVVDSPTAEVPLYRPTPTGE